MKHSVKYILAAASILLWCLSPSNGQSLEAVKSRLATTEGNTRAAVNVDEKGDAAEIVRVLRSVKPTSRVSGYRIGIFFDNKQGARDGAAYATSRFKELFPDIPVYMSYDNPYFKVSAGNCLTSEEAIILWGRVRSSFPLAVVSREDIDINLLAE